MIEYQGKEYNSVTEMIAYLRQHGLYKREDVPTYKLMLRKERRDRLEKVVEVLVEQTRKDYQQQLSNLRKHLIK